jgi:hypothetical protein
MSTSDAYEWDLTVPGDDGDGMGEALPAFFGSFDRPADLAERSSEILRAEFPNGR